MLTIKLTFINRSEASSNAPTTIQSFSTRTVHLWSSWSCPLLTVQMTSCALKMKFLSYCACLIPPKAVVMMTSLHNMHIAVILYVGILNLWHHVKGKIASGQSCCEGWRWCSWWRWRVVDVPKFHSWGMCTMPLTNVNSYWMSNASPGVCIILDYLYYITQIL